VKIDFDAEEVHYYDSMGGRNTHCLQVENVIGHRMFTFQILALCLTKFGRNLDTWKFFPGSRCPSQDNGSDCGGDLEFQNLNFENLKNETETEKPTDGS
jgi:Ulp1 family protease